MDHGGLPQRGWETARDMRYLLAKPEYRSPDHEAHLRLKSGNANLPIGGFRDANREIDVPRENHQTILRPMESPGLLRSSLSKAEGEASKPPLEPIKTAKNRRADRIENVMRILAIRD